MYQNASTKCLTDKSLRLITSDVEDLVFRYVFPAEFFMGVLGNALNLWILSCHGMRNRANDLLAAVSLSDLLFFLFMLPHSLAVFKNFHKNMTFRYYYYMTRQELSAFANWCSAAAIWFIFAVTVERFLVIRTPLRSRIYWKKSERLLIFALILTATGLLTMYHHFEYDCTLVYFCNNTQIYDYCYSAGTVRHPGTWDQQNITIEPSSIRRYYIRISTVSNAIFVVFVPIMAVGFLNMLLINRLQVQDQTVLKTAKSNTQMTLTAQNKQKRRVTITVILISSCFALTQGPSAVMSVWELLIGYSSNNPTLFVFMSIANGLVITGKTINFVLFCLKNFHS
uniref:G-protein coupled receptors family 1 profile domain-containing protein n=1 Tax=Panagrolaimus sp. JU765 TaxID=591449 RepID=A0AC34QU54_9BILA